MFFVIFFILFALINYYIFIRGYEALAIVPQLDFIYIFLFLILSFSFLIAKIFEKRLPKILYNFLLETGSYWFVVMLYSFMIIVSLDVIRILNSFMNFLPVSIYDNYNEIKLIIGVVTVLTILLIIFLGYRNTEKIRIKTLNLSFRKKNSSFKSLNAVLVSDIHLSPLNNERLLEKIVGKINDLHPDIVFIAGDIVDDHAKILEDRNIGVSLKGIQSKYGVFVSTGNHEFINGIKGSVEYINKFGFHLLRDEIYQLQEGLTIIGRDDSSKKSFTKENRKSLEEILNVADKNYPMILLDHTPFKLEQAERNDIDLQLSGHTHHGQLFPLNFITSMIYEKSWGYLKRGATQYYVSCGVGTWGPKVRTGSISEIVNLKITFE